MNPVDFIKEKVGEFNDWIKEDINDYSGKASQSLKVEIDGNTVISIGADYIELLNRGSHPWSNPDKYKSLGFILNKNGWAVSKGLNPYAVAYNLAHFGSQIFQGKKKGLQIEDKKERLQKELKEQLPQYIKIDVKQRLDKFTQKFKNSLS